MKDIITSTATDIRITLVNVYERIKIMGTIRINGNEITFADGANISICNGSVQINGSFAGNYDSNTPKIEVHGNVGELDCKGSATINGDVKGHVDAGGSVHCGNVGSYVDAGGSVHCGTVSGRINAGGSVTVN